MSTLTDVATFFHRPSPQILSGLTNDKGPVGDLARTFVEKKIQLMEQVAADNGIDLKGENTELPDETELSPEAEKMFRELNDILKEAPKAHLKK